MEKALTELLTFHNSHYNSVAASIRLFLKFSKPKAGSGTNIPASVRDEWGGLGSGPAGKLVLGNRNYKN